MLGFLHAALTYTVPFVLVLTLVVTIHELGHFLVAKSFGVGIDRFSIGFGRALVSWRDKSGVEWRIGWIPLGGYVRFAGDENDASVPDNQDLEAMRRDIVKREGAAALGRYFQFKPIWQRAAITAAGPLANFLLAVLLFAFLLMTFGERSLSARLASVEPGSPAAVAGFRAGDLVLKANGRDIADFSDLQQTVRVRGGVRTEFLVERGDREVLLVATPEWRVIKDPIAGEQRGGVLGLVPRQTREDFVVVRYNPLEAVIGGFERTGRTLETTVYYLGRMIRGQVATDQLSGPLGIARLSGKVAQMGADGAPDFGTMMLSVSVNLLQFAAFISVGIGFMNLLPVPILDGGHLLFYAYEAVARRPLTAKVQAAGYRVGLALLLGLMLFATWNDLQQMRVFKILGGLFS